LACASEGSVRGAGKLPSFSAAAAIAGCPFRSTMPPDPKNRHAIDSFDQRAIDSRSRSTNARQNHIWLKTSK
jgi:hypothetical protein